MTMEELRSSLTQYKNQLKMVSEALPTVGGDEERESLITLQSDLNQLIQLTQDSLNTLEAKEKICEVTASRSDEQSEKPVIDDEYALFMEEMARSGAYESNSCQEQLDCSKSDGQNLEDSDIEEELSTLLGMKCAVYHTHKWGGQPTLHNAMVSAVVPRQDDDQYNDLKVKVLFTHPTHTEMLPCPYYLDGECKFDDEQCRYSHGAVIKLSDLKDSIDPDFDSIKTGSRILLKIKPTDDEDVSITKKSTEKYHLWHRAIVRSVDLEKRICVAKLEHGVKAGQKRKLGADECQYSFEEIFPLNTECLETSSDDDLSDTEYPENKTLKETDSPELLIEKSAPSNAPAMGAWERHTRGMGSRLMLAMGYVPGTGLGAAGDGRLRPVEARALPVGKSLDHCMTISETAASRDPLQVEQKLRKLQKREEDRNKRAYEREKEREKRNVFNFLNKTLGNQPEGSDSLNAASSVDIKQSTSRDLNIEQFKIMEDVKRVEREVAKLNSSLSRCPAGSSGHKNLTMQIIEKNKQLEILKRKENQISKEQSQRKNKEKMTVF